MNIRGGRVEVYFPGKFELSFKRYVVEGTTRGPIMIKLGFLHIFIKTGKKSKKKHSGYQMSEKDSHINKKLVDGRNR